MFFGRVGQPLLGLRGAIVPISHMILMQAFSLGSAIPYLASLDALPLHSADLAKLHTRA